MALSFTSTSASSLRMNSLVFPSSSSINFESNKLPLPFPPLRRRKAMKVVSAKKNNMEIVSQTEYYGDFWMPEKVSRPGIWSIRDDLPVPPSPFFPELVQAREQSPPMTQEFQSVIGQLFQRRIIRLGGEVGFDMANFIVAQLLYLDAADPNKDIVMYVNSPGGSVNAGLAIFDTMRHIRPDVSTVCVGLAASMGAFLLAAGTKGKRYSLPSSRIMIHQPLGGSQGYFTDIDAQTNEMLFHKKNLGGHLALMTGQTWQKVNEDTDRDYFMSANEAKAYGIVDDVIINPMKAVRKPLEAIAG